jgi:peptide/nickel transport system permease protein
MSLKYLSKRLIYVVITIFFVIVFNYALFRLMPGDPMTMLARNPKISAEALDSIRSLFGLDLPWYKQFFVYVQNLLHGELGMSFTFKTSVASIIKSRIGPTLALLVTSEIFATIIGLTVGVVAAWKRGKKADLGIMGFSLVMYSMPTFWLGMLMVVVFSVQLRFFPISGMLTPGFSYATTGAAFYDFMRHLILPCLVLVLNYIAEYAITMRNTLTDILSEDYILTAKAKGFPDRYVLRKHALPNALLPVTTLVMMNLGFVVAGTIEVETIFSWPGLGRLMYEAIYARDYPLLQGVFMLTTIFVVFANFLADITYVYLDPRVKY